MAAATDLHALAGELVAATPDLGPARARLAISLYRLLARGAPVAIQTLAADLGLGEQEVRATLDSWTGVFFDDGGRIVGFWGLALPEMPHRLEVDGVALHTWCAWDALFLPPLLGGMTRVTSRCPVTGQTVRLTVSPHGIQAAEPAGAMLSFLRPDRPFDEDILRSFCHFVLFFASRQAGEQWTAEHPGTFLLSLEEGFELGRLTNDAHFGGALNPPDPMQPVKGGRG